MKYPISVILFLFFTTNCFSQKIKTSVEVNLGICNNLQRSSTNPFKMGINKGLSLKLTYQKKELFFLPFCNLFISSNKFNTLLYQSTDAKTILTTRYLFSGIGFGISTNNHHKISANIQLQFARLIFPTAEIKNNATFLNQSSTLTSSFSFSDDDLTKNSTTILPSIATQISYNIFRKGQSKMYFGLNFSQNILAFYNRPKSIIVYPSSTTNQYSFNYFAQSFFCSLGFNF
jgi:hypothetical protein